MDSRILRMPFEILSISCRTFKDSIKRGVRNLKKLFGIFLKMFLP